MKSSNALKASRHIHRAHQLLGFGGMKRKYDEAFAGHNDDDDDDDAPILICIKYYVPSGFDVEIPIERHQLWEHIKHFLPINIKRENLSLWRYTGYCVKRFKVKCEFDDSIDMSRVRQWELQRELVSLFRAPSKIRQGID